MPKAGKAEAKGTAEAVAKALANVKEEVKEAKKRVQREKKVYELPGQTKETPPEVCLLQCFLYSCS